MIYGKKGGILQNAYGFDAHPLKTAYDLGGQVVFGKKADYSNYSVSDYCSVSIPQMQGFDIFNGVIFNFRANSSTVNNIMATVNAQTNTIIKNDIVAASDHGDSASFSTEYYEEGDDYPLLYVTADTNPGKVYVNRVTQTTSQLIKTLIFPLDKAGYYSAHCFDEENNIMYMVGYSQQNYQTDGGGSNKTVISKWDMTNLTDNGDGTFTPAFVSSVERPFIYVMQGQQFHDGMLWIASGGTNYNGYIYALDPTDGTLLYTVNTRTTTEVEGLAFISDNEMVFGLQGGTYKKVTFPAN